MLMNKTYIFIKLATVDYPVMLMLPCGWIQRSMFGMYQQVRCPRLQKQHVQAIKLINVQH